MLERRIKKQIARLKRFGVSVSLEHAKRDLRKQRRKSESRSKYDDEE